MHGSPDPGLAGGGEQRCVLGDLDAVFLAVVKGVFIGATPQLAFCAVAIEVAGAHRWVQTGGLAHGIGGAGSAVAAFVALEVAYFVDDHAGVVQVVSYV